MNALLWPTRSTLFYPTLLLLVLGWIMVASASTGIADLYTGNAFYFATRHSVYLVLSLLVLIATPRIPMRWWQSVDAYLLALSFIGLVLVFLPGIGHEVNGSQRWLNLGVIKIQASELAKVAAVFFIAGYLIRQQKDVQSRWSGFLRPLVIIAFMVLLLLMEPDFGAVVVLMGAVLTQLFLGGVKAGQFFVLVFVTLIMGVLVLTSESYRMERLLGYLDPFAPEHVFGSGYQLSQSLIAFGRGEWFGVGLGESIQKLFYLPEAHTDFVFAIWAEETGLAGALLALAALAALNILAWRLVWRAQQSQQLYSAYVVTGFAMLLALQTVINLGVNTGLLPTKGLTLPFFSYGGSSLLVCCFIIGVMMRVEYELTDTNDDETDASSAKEVQRA